MNRKDVRGLLKEVERQGFQVVRTSTGHSRVFTADGRFVTSVSCTPSDYRGWKNTLAQLKRFGFAPA